MSKNYPNIFLFSQNTYLSYRTTSERKEIFLCFHLETPARKFKEFVAVAFLFCIFKRTFFVWRENQHENSSFRRLYKLKRSHPYKVNKVHFVSWPLGIRICVSLEVVRTELNMRNNCKERTKTKEEFLNSYKMSELSING